MAESGERSFKLVATLESIEKGQDLDKFPNMTILRWLHEGMPWDEFESRLQVLFGQPNPFNHPDTPEGPRVVSRIPASPNGGTPITELSGVGKWPYMGVGSLVRSLDGRLVNEDFSPLIKGVDSVQLGVGSRVKFASIAVAEYRAGEPVETVLFAHPITNSPKARG